MSTIKTLSKFVMSLIEDYIDKKEAINNYGLTIDENNLKKIKYDRYLLPGKNKIKWMQDVTHQKINNIIYNFYYDPPALGVAKYKKNVYYRICDWSQVYGKYYANINDAIDDWNYYYNINKYKEYLKDEYSYTHRIFIMFLFIGIILGFCIDQFLPTVLLSILLIFTIPRLLDNMIENKIKIHTEQLKATQVLKDEDIDEDNNMIKDINDKLIKVKDNTKYALDSNTIMILGKIIELNDRMIKNINNLNIDERSYDEYIDTNISLIERLEWFDDIKGLMIDCDSYNDMISLLKETIEYSYELLKYNQFNIVEDKKTMNMIKLKVQNKIMKDKVEYIRLLKK